MSLSGGAGADLHAARQARLAARGGVVRAVALPDGSSLAVAEQAGLEIGSVSWAGGEALAAFIVRAPALVRGLRVVELGAGLGVAGRAAARAGAAAVALTDRAPLVPLLARAAADEAAAAAARGGGKIEISVAELNWGAAAWRAAALPADLLLGADVVYEPAGAAALAELLDAALAPAGGAARALVAYKERGAGPPFRAALRGARIALRVAAVDGEHEIWMLERE